MRRLAPIAVLLVAACGGSQAADTLANVPPRARLASPVYAPVGQAIILDASDSFDPDGTVVEYTFSFSDSAGKPSQITLGTPEVSHTFAQAGAYEVAVVVRDDDGTLARATQLVVVRSDPPPCTDANGCSVDTQCLYSLCYATGSRPGPGSAACVADTDCGADRACRAGLCISTSGAVLPSPTP